MKVFLSIIIFIFSFFNSNAQRFHAGIAGGLANYNGDLLEKLYARQQTNGFIGVTLHYEIYDQLILRGAFNFAQVNGSDKYNAKTVLHLRNLSFESAISEFSVVAELYLFNLNQKRISPYGFAGIALFHFNPYTYDTTNKKIFLHPLSTEGQGIYPNKKTYSLLQPAIPFGGGIKFAVNENLRIGIEFGFRKLFTDYLDDVSTSYADFNDLLTAKGPVATELAYRGDEITGGNPAYPTKDTQRGSSAQKDDYYFTGINISFRIGNGGGGGAGSYKISGKKNKLGCPAVPL